jgi:hypothetical protein
MSGLQRDKRDRNPPERQECTFDEVRGLNTEAFICQSFTGREKVFRKGTYVCVAKAVGLEGKVFRTLCGYGDDILRIPVGVRGKVDHRSQVGT